MIQLLLSRPSAFVVSVLALITAITVHEFAHAWTATRLGDPTPRLQGRLNLNPLSHLDPLGTLMLLIAGFGWGKPVQFDPYNLENPRRDAAIISLAGPFSNLLSAAFFSLLLRLTLASFSPFAFAANLIYPFITLNVVLAVFNLLPIHPLDGGKVLVGLLPRENALKVDQFLNTYGMFILIIMIFPVFGGTSPVLSFLGPITQFLISLYIPGSIGV